MLQQLIVGLHRGRNFRLHGGQIIKFIDHGNIQVDHAGLTVTAVGAGSTIGMKRCVGDDGSVIFRLVRRGFVGYSVIHLLFGIVAAQDGTDCRTVNA